MENALVLLQLVLLRNCCAKIDSLKFLDRKLLNVTRNDSGIIFRNISVGFSERELLTGTRYPKFVKNESVSPEIGKSSSIPTDEIINIFELLPSYL